MTSAPSSPFHRLRAAGTRLAIIAAAMVGLAVGLAIIQRHRGSRPEEPFFQVKAVELTARGRQTVCDNANANASAACGMRNRMNVHDLNVNNRVFFRDESMRTQPDGKTNNSDPYYLEKKTYGGGNRSSLRLTINDDADESFQIWGDSCRSPGGCGGPGKARHAFVANGAAAHAGSLSVGVGNLPAEGANPTFTGLNVRRRDGRWSHLDWRDDGKNYLRGQTVVDDGVQVPAGGCVELGFGDKSKEVNAGKICYGRWDRDALDVVGKGAPGKPRTVRVYDRLVTGQVTANTGVALPAGSCVELGVGDTSKEVNAGKICYGRWDANALDVVGKGIVPGQRRVRVHDRLVTARVTATDRLCVDRTCLTGGDIVKLKRLIAGPSTDPPLAQVT